MFSADFREFGRPGETARPERLFRAAISAYCSLVRPTRRDAARLDDLALPLYDSTPPTARRFAAAALSECRRVPLQLVRRLCEEPVDVSAPLLVRSPAIGDAELVMLIARRGLPHARAIARRPRLHPAIASLLDAIRDPEIQRLRGAGPRAAASQSDPSQPFEPRIDEDRPAEGARRKLRAMMRPAGLAQFATRPDAEGDEIFRRLRETALSGHLPLFQTALADALCVDLEAARRMTAQDGCRDLCVALKSLDMTEERAFLLAAALFPAAAASVEAIRLFLYRYRLSEAETTDAAADDACEPAGEAIRQAS